MTPPNPIKPIQEALERVLHESGLQDFGRSMSSIDDLTAEVQHVYQRVDDIERVLETIVPVLERLTVIFEDIQSDLEPMSELASKIPGSGSRRRRREREAAGRLPAGAAVPRPAQTPRAGGPAPTADGSARVPIGPPSAPAGPDSVRPGPDRPGQTPGATSPAAVPPSSTLAPPPSGGTVRPGATGYSPHGSRDRDGA